MEFEFFRGPRSENSYRSFFLVLKYPRSVFDFKTENNKMTLNTKKKTSEKMKQVNKFYDMNLKGKTMNHQGHKSV